MSNSSDFSNQLSKKLTLPLANHIVDILRGEREEAECRIPAPQLTPLLKSAGVDYKEYGFEKLWPFIKRVADLDKRLEPHWNGEYSYVVLHENEDIVAEEDSECRPSTVLPGDDQGEDSREAQYYARIVSMRSYRSSPVPQSLFSSLPKDDFQKEVFLYPEHLFNVAPMKKNDSPIDVLHALDISWKSAVRNNALRLFKTNGGTPQIVFPLSPRFTEDYGTLTEVSIRQSPDAPQAGRDDRKPWQLCNVHSRSFPATVFDPVTVLREFASFDNLKSLIGDLADYAEPEDWDNNISDAASLEFYLAATLTRLKSQRKLSENDKGDVVVANTGLLTRESREPIYMLFFQFPSTRLEFSTLYAARDIPLSFRKRNFVKSCAGVIEAAHPATYEQDIWPNRVRLLADTEFDVTRILNSSWSDFIKSRQTSQNRREEQDGLDERWRGHNSEVVEKARAATENQKGREYLEQQLFESIEETKSHLRMNHYSYVTPAYRPETDSVVFLLRVEVSGTPAVLVIERQGDEYRCGELWALAQAWKYVRVISPLLGWN